MATQEVGARGLELSYSTSYLQHRLMGGVQLSNRVCQGLLSKNAIACVLLHPFLLTVTQSSGV